MLVLSVHTSLSAIVASSWYGVDVPNNWCDGKCPSEVVTGEIDCAISALQASAYFYCNRESECYYPKATSEYMFGNQRDGNGFQCRKLGKYTHS